MAVLASLRQALRAAQEQNTTLRSRLARIHADSDLSDLPAMMPDTGATLPRGLNQTLSYSSSCMSEFFDAREYINSGEDTEEEEMDDGESEEDRSDTEDEQTFHEVNTSGETIPADSDKTPEPGSLSVLDTFTGRR